MDISLGQYSFAEIPRDFWSIIGLTGTLKSLNKTQVRIIRDDFSIQLNTFIPSVYGRKNLVFNEQLGVGIFIENELTYNKIICQQIKDSRNQRGGEFKRPVIVFFATKEDLMNFYESSDFDEFRAQSVYLIEEASVQVFFS